MSISERVRAAEAALLKTKDDLTKATADLEANPEDEATLALVEELATMHDKQQKTLDALKRAEQALMARALPAGSAVTVQSSGGGTNDPPGQQSQSAPIVVRRQEPKQAGDIIFKHATVMLLAHAKRCSPEQIIEMYFKDLPYVRATWDYVKGLQHVSQMANMGFQSIEKTAVDPALTTVSGWASELTRTDVQGFMTNLAPVSIAANLAGRSLSINFDGFSSVTVPRRNPVASTATEPAWVGEAGVIPLTKFAFGSTTLNRYKLAAITTMSREIADRSAPAIQGVLTDALREAYGMVLDAALISNVAAVTNVRPAGLRSGASSSAGAAGGGEDAVRADIMSMMSGLASNNLGVRPVLIVNNLDALSVSMMTSALSTPIFAAELAAGNLLGIPIIVSANMPQHMAMMVDAAYFASAFDPPTFDVSDVATVVEANADGTAPTQAGTAGSHPGAVGTAGQVPVNSGIPVSGGSGAASTGYTARSLWQTYSLGIRMIAPTSWNVMQTGAVQVKTSTTWS